MIDRKGFQILLVMLIGVFSLHGQENMRIGPGTTIDQLVHHPAFQGFGQYLLPNDTTRYDEKVQLKDAMSDLFLNTPGGLDVVIPPVNRLIDEVSAGRKIFYEFYTEAEKKSDPTKLGTGLFFFRGKPGAPFVIHCPGGAFLWVCSWSEGFPHALELSGRGYNTFVLRYRVGQGSETQRLATQDLAAALSFVFEHAKELQVDTKNYSLWGTSAGARLAAGIGSYGAAAFGGKDLPGPATVVMAYTAYGDYARREPPTYVVVGENDGIAPPATMERRVRALRNVGADVEFHVYPNIGHGFGLGVGTSAAGWMDGAIRFWEAHMLQ